MSSKFALVIANTEYQDASFAKLTAPGKDAEEFAEVLRDVEFASFDDVQILLNEGESRIRRSIARFFADRKRDDLLLLYFSGHGIRNSQGQLFLAASDTDIKILEATGIPSEFVTYAMNNSRSQRQLLILDCCNSGAFAYGSKSAVGVGKSMGIGSAFEGSGFGRVVLTATDATQYAWEGDKVIGNTQKSVFTHFLIEGLKGEADRNGDGRIDVDELYDYAYEQVVRRTPQQTPGKWSYKQQGDIVLRENVKLRNGRLASLPSDLLEMLSHHNSTVRRAAIQDLISLLHGKNLNLARAAQESLRQIAENDDSLSLRRIAGNALIAHGVQIEAPNPFDIPRENIKDENNSKRLPSLKQTQVSTPVKLPVQTKSLQTKTKSNPRLIIGIAGGLLVISILIWSGFKLLQNLSAATVEPTFTSQPSATIASQSEQTNFPLPAETRGSPASSNGIGSTMISEKDGMTLVYIPAGHFKMGMDAAESLAECLDVNTNCKDTETGNDIEFRTEEPLHEVDLAAFWIDLTEVTNNMYAKCVSDGRCRLPQSTIFRTEPYYGNPKYDNYSVVSVLWEDANAYCAWAGRRLPIEAEWEKAARGPDGNIYPWGNEFNGELVNFCDTKCTGDLANDTYNDGYDGVAPVGSYPAGKSFYGALDMAGNVWEWVDGWFDVYPGGNPSLFRESEKDDRVLRGGAYYGRSIFVRGADRFHYDPGKTRDSFGFRCAMDATP